MDLASRSRALTSPGTWSSPINSERRKTHGFSSDQERLRSFGTAIDVLREYVDAGFRALSPATRENTACARARAYMAQIKTPSDFTLIGALRRFWRNEDAGIAARLFPDLAREQVRLMVPHLRAICHEHRVPYHTRAALDRRRRYVRRLLRRLATIRD